MFKYYAENHDELTGARDLDDLRKLHLRLESVKTLA
jgi:hypothetical protein